MKKKEISDNCIKSTANISVELTHSKAVIPFKTHSTDTCYDITATGVELIEKGREDFILGDNNYTDRIYYSGIIKYYTGLIMCPERGYGITLRPRSSIWKYDLMLCNSLGTIDEGYLGEIVAFFRVLKPVNVAKIYNIGDRILQMTVEPRFECSFDSRVLSSLSSDRGVGGFGSTGK